MKIIWTRHAEERQKEWEKKLAITREEVENLLCQPEQVVPGDREVLIAQTIRGKGLLRAAFIEGENRQKKVLTLYWTTKIEKYWKGALNENPL